MKHERLRLLNEKERQHICQFIRVLIPIAKDMKHPMRKVAKWQIKQTLWRWTADAFNTQSGAVQRDAIKFEVCFQRHTRKAFKVKQQTGNKGLRHEHVVPRGRLAIEIIEQDMSVEDILKFLCKWCHAVIVTRGEDKRIRPTDDMPEGWTFASGKLYQRYIDSGLMHEICDPSHNGI
ncbi:MAG TPA: hypothetical protein VMG59_05970 [Phycisphaerae bacterium]|nr:hypothetical protein [Phycisphaerae bacterium]